MLGYRGAVSGVPTQPLDVLSIGNEKGEFDIQSIAFVLKRYYSMQKNSFSPLLLNFIFISLVPSKTLNSKQL